MKRLDAGPYELHIFGLDILADSPQEISALYAELSPEVRGQMLRALLATERHFWRSMSIKEKKCGRTARARIWARSRRAIEAIAPDIDLNENN